MDMWSILGIEPTDDIRKIKKAYAQKLKIYHPEDDTQGFQRLRQAYDAALKYSKFRATNSLDEIRRKSDPENETVNGEKLVENVSGGEDSVKEVRKDQVLVKVSLSEEDRDKEAQNERALIEEVLDENLRVEKDPLVLQIETDETDAGKPPNLKNFNQEFLIEVRKLYDDYNSRIQIDHWSRLFASDLIWDIQNKNILGFMMLNFLAEHRFLPHEVWVLLDSYFDWSEEFHYYHQKGQLLQLIVDEVNNSSKLSFHHLDGIQGIDLEEYFIAREAAYQAIETKNIVTAYVFWNKAKEIYAGDPELLYIDGKCLSSLNKPDEAMKVFGQLLAIVPNHIAGLLCVADLYFKQKQYHEAIEALRKIEEVSPEDIRMMYNMAVNYKKINDLVMAREYLRKVLALNPNYAEGLVFLLELDGKILKSWRTKRRLIQSEFETVREEYKALKQKLKQESQSGPRKAKVKRQKKAKAFSWVFAIGSIAILFLAFATKCNSYLGLQLVWVLLCKNTFRGKN